MYEMLMVGKKAPKPYWEFTKKNKLGTILEQSTGHWIMICYMPNLTEHEIEAYRKNKIVSRYIANSTNTVVLALFGVEVRNRDTLLIFEIAFDPCLYPEHEWKQRQEAYYRDNIINFLLIDSNDGTIRAMRSFNMPIKLREIWLKSWNKSYLIENYSEIYRNWKDRIDLTYSVDELWNVAKDGGFFGEPGKLTEASFELSDTIQLEDKEMKK